MHRYHPFRIGVRWITRNSITERLSRNGVPASPPIRYETLVREPRSVIEDILRRAEVPFEPNDLRFIQDGHVDLSTTHTVMGNPSRLNTGLIPLSLDEEWRSAFDRRRAAVITALTFPMLRKYGYR
jgi:hypothetical protein